MKICTSSLETQVIVEGWKFYIANEGLKTCYTIKDYVNFFLNFYSWFIKFKKKILYNCD